MNTELIGMLSNHWWATVANDYSVTIALAISFIMTALKILAKLHPSNKSDEILCLIQGWAYGFPGAKKEEAPKP